MFLPYDLVFSKFRGRINDPKELLLDLNDLIEIYSERLHAVAESPRVIKKFKQLSLDDEIQQISFQLKNPVNDEMDTEFVAGLFALGMAIMWLKPQVDSILNTAPMIGGKEEKKIIDNHKSMIDRLDKMEVEFKKRLSDYGYLNNAYISET